MSDVRFADIFFILLVCVVTFGILYLVNRGKSQAAAKGSVSKAETTVENNE